jgi:anaerobic dimethyl sulfoxide reductase subunit C (anchor subunit)
MNLREWALPVYTILVQLAFGALLALWMLRDYMARHLGKEHVDHLFDNTILIIFVTITMGMIGAHFHLSKPQLSFLAILNLRHSWLSREILFNLLFFFSVGCLLYLQLRGQNAWRIKTWLGWLAILFGCGNVYCMAHIYLLPTQLAWNTPLTFLSFFSTALLLGMIALASILIMDLKYSELRSLPKAYLQAHVIHYAMKWFAALVGFLALLVIAENFYQLYALSQKNLPSAMVSLELLQQLYPVLLGMRLMALTLGAAGLIVSVYWYFPKVKHTSDLLAPAYVTLLLILIGEILGRFLFYATHVRLGV